MLERSVDMPPDTSAATLLGGPLVEVLRELRGVVGSLSAAQYTARGGPLFSDATIGGHVRHCLDHARALVDGLRDGRVDYDHRERGTPVEHDPAAAHEEISRLERAAMNLCNADPGRPLRICVMPSRSGPAVLVRSTLGREMSFVLSHTVHHNAMVRGMATALGAAVPQTFGYAPSTLAHLDATACAR